MSFWRRLFCRPRVLDPDSPLRQRLTRLRRLNRCYRDFLGFFLDAAEKEGGGFILDRQYIVSVGERAFRLGYEIVFHSNVLQPGIAPGSYAELDRLKADLRDLLAGKRRPPEGGPAVPMLEERRSQGESAGRRAPGAAGLRPAAAVSPGELREERRHRVRLIENEGYVASPGVAAGPVSLVETEADLQAFPEQGVLVARRLEPTAALLRTLPHVAAILVEEATPADPIAGLARAFRVPALLGLPGATRRLPPGALVTVDATDAAVYAGAFEMLLLHHRLHGDSHGEEPEDRLLNGVLREMGSPLLATAHPEAPAGDPRTLCGIVQNVYTATLAQFVTASFHARQSVLLPAPGFSRGIWALDLYAPAPGGPAEAAGKGEISDPSAWLLAGLISAAGDGEDGRVAREASGVVYRSEESATAFLRGKERTVLLDALVAGGAAGNHVMLVASAGAGGGSEEALDGTYAEAVRLGLVAIRAAGVVVAWRERIPPASARETLTRVGELACQIALGPGAAGEPAGRG
jgi:phosphohistidine swiveling domain-containing protein